jgi:hypothetical protein
VEGQHVKEQKLNLFWFLPTGSDGPYLGSTLGHRPADFSYLREIAVAADRLGFGGILLPMGNNCLDGWTLGSALAPATQALKFLLALRAWNSVAGTRGPPVRRVRPRQRRPPVAEHRHRRVAARARGIGKQAYEPGRHFVADYASEPPRIAAE